MAIADSLETGIRLRSFAVCEALLEHAGLDPSSIQTLDGQSGAGDSRVANGPDRQSPNNLLVTGSGSGGRFSVVAGGLTYTDFAKYASLAEAGPGETVGGLCLFAEDPVGYGLEPGSEWNENDWFYLAMGDGDPFQALEAYGDAVQTATHAAPEPYYFPTVCGWYASMPLYGGGQYMNDTAGTVREVEYAAASGFLEYAPVAVRLVPDTYDGTSSKHENPAEAGYTASMYSPDRNTEQGWWDDAHWRQHGHYVEPFETSEKWAAAIRERGGIPLTYVQTGHVSYDYAREHPDHMLGNDISKLDEIFIGHNPLVTFDYTDPGFADHLRNVWGRLGKAGVAGVFFDYPNQAWIEEEGLFEDRQATTASAYRRVFAYAKQGLPKPSWIQERNVARKVPYLDITAGIVDSQRVWGDTDGLSMEMIRMCALRWYKTRKLFSYDTDAKNLIKIAAESRDRLRQVLTLLYLLTGRLLLANSFRDMGAELVHDLSRIYPAHTAPLTPRPLDAFAGGELPLVYGMWMTPDHCLIVLLNPDPEKDRELSVPLLAPPMDGGPGLPEGSAWMAWDFWNDAFIGEFPASSTLSQSLRPSEARAISLRKKRPFPHLITSDRHLLQGFLEIDEETCDAPSKQLFISLSLVKGEPLKLVFHHAGMQFASADCLQAGVSVSQGSRSDLLSISLLSASSTSARLVLRWTA